MSWAPRNPFKRNSRNTANQPVEADRNAKKRTAQVGADKPIRKAEDDALGRARAARSFAEQILSLDATAGIVVGVLGAWGSGKTSFVNLARTHFDELGIVVLDFNPWMFSGAEQLVESFFVEISAQLKLRPALAEIGKNLEFYGDVFSGLGWLPVVGSWIERGQKASKLLAQALQHRKVGVGARRAVLERELEALQEPIVVVVDDIDRLTTPEIRDIFKLVRLTASFPNIVYVLCFDRVRVEEALTEVGIAGRDYLEKILQVSIDLPAVPPATLNSQVLRAIESALANVDNPGPFDDQAWPDVFAEIIRPLIRNMRDVRRYSAAIHGAVRHLEGGVSLVDVLALEAVRLFLPDVFREMYGAVDGLTTTSDSAAGQHRRPELKRQIDDLIKAAGDRASIVQTLISRLFPAAAWHISNYHHGADWKGRWLQERRVAHEYVLRYYLERIVGEGLQTFTDAERAWSYIADPVTFEKYLRSLDPERLQDIIASLEAYEDKFGPENVESATVVLLNLLPEIPQRRGGMLGLDSRLVITRVVYRLIRSLNDTKAIESAVQRVLPQLSSLSSKWELIRLVGHQENVGHKLVSESAAAEFEANWREEVRLADPHALARERTLLGILFAAKSRASAMEPSLVVPDAPFMTLAILVSARGEVVSQALGSRAVRRSARLAWDELVQVYGTEDVLGERIRQLRTSPLGAEESLLELAERYASGWRPKAFEED